MGFDQMQYMANPFGIPGPYGPMGPDPMGPMPGQMPVPRARATVAELLGFSEGSFLCATLTKDGTLIEQCHRISEMEVSLCYTWGREVPLSEAVF